MRINKHFIIIFSIIMLCPLFRVNADSGGYIIKLKEGFKPQDYLSSLSVVDENKGLYFTNKADNLNDFNYRIEYIESNDEVSLVRGIERVQLYSSPLDEYFPEQWQSQMLNIDSVWDYETYGNDINIAVIDSGCNIHEDIYPNIAGGYNYIRKSEEYKDNIGHGTHVSGVIASCMNDIGISGMAPKSKIYALKCFDTGAKTTVLMLSQAIYDAVDKYNCKIINMSLGLESDKLTLYNAIKYAYDKGVIIIAAVGNDGNSLNYYPASYDEVIGVGSVGLDKQQSYFSQTNDSVYVVAPGERVKSLYKEAEYIELEGTSQAAAYVTGIVATMLSANDLSVDEVKENLKATSEDLGDTGKDNLYGYGLVDANKLFFKCIEDISYYVSPISNNNVVIYNNTDKSINAVSIFAEYEDEKMIDSELKDIILLSHKKVNIHYADSGGNLKFFLWDSLSNLNPLSKTRRN